MFRNLYFFIFLILVSCADKNSFEAESNVPTNEIPSTGDGGNEVVDLPSAKQVCYPTGCITTTSLETIGDAKRDYIYPNVQNFPDEVMRPFYNAPIAAIDLLSLPEKLKISENFLLKDYMSPAKGRYGLFSSLVVGQMQALRSFVNQPVFINSGYRSPGYNNRTPGSASWSRHTYGDAVDFTVAGKKISELTALCRKFGASFTLTYERHIHCDWRKYQSDSAFYGEPNIGPKSQPDFNIAQMIAAQSRILLQIEDNSYVFSTDVEIEEDSHHEGELTHEWIITFADGRVEKFSTSKIEIAKPSSRIQVDVLVGGSIPLRAQF